MSNIEQSQNDDVTRVLWVSDVDIRYDQREDLRKHCGGKFLISHIRLYEVHSYHDIVKAVSENNCKFIILDIHTPDWLIEDLTRNTNIPVLKAIATRVLTGDKVFDCNIGEFTDVYQTVHLRFDEINF
jgi:hypothetical protein